jgi:asparagine synthase (glutamine-hydrolysing)
MGLPKWLKVKNAIPKYVLKKSCEGLIPDDIVYRRKVGFGAPMREWLRGEFGRAAEATIMASPLRNEKFFDYNQIQQMFRDHRAGRDSAVRLWTLYNLTAWFDRWVAGRVE